MKIQKIKTEVEDIVREDSNSSLAKMIKFHISRNENGNVFHYKNL